MTIEFIDNSAPQKRSSTVEKHGSNYIIECFNDGKLDFVFSKTTLDEANRIAEDWIRE